MSHGDSKITRRSTLSDETRLALTKHPYFLAPVSTFQLQDHFIYDGIPSNEFDQLVLDILQQEGMPTKGNTIEYWFQRQSEGQHLAPHCDYNHSARSDLSFDPYEWYESDKKEKFISPITLSCYLEVSSDMEGGELCISSQTWMEDLNPDRTKEDLVQYPYETYLPSQGDIIYFHGSMHFHWIEPVLKGSRKSMLINFWPLDL